MLLLHFCFTLEPAVRTPFAAAAGPFGQFVISSGYLDRFAGAQRFRNFFPGLIQDALKGSARHIHAQGSRLLVKSFQITEPHRFQLLNRKRYRASAGLLRNKNAIVRYRAHPAALKSSWHISPPKQNEHMHIISIMCICSFVNTLAKKKNQASCALIRQGFHEAALFSPLPRRILHGKIRNRQFKFSRNFYYGLAECWETVSKRIRYLAETLVQPFQVFDCHNNHLPKEAGCFPSLRQNQPYSLLHFA
jgi:hypothetical protein